MLKEIHMSWAVQQHCWAFAHSEIIQSGWQCWIYQIFEVLYFYEIMYAVAYLIKIKDHLSD